MRPTDAPSPRASEVAKTRPMLADADAEADMQKQTTMTKRIDSSTDAAALAAEMVSWAVGVAFGRFDVRLATGARVLPAEPGPFDPLPVCSPAMLTGDDGLPLTAAPSGYPITFPENGILVDDPGHARDLTAAVRAVFDEVFSDRAPMQVVERGCGSARPEGPRSAGGSRRASSNITSSATPRVAAGPQSCGSWLYPRVATASGSMPTG